MNTYLTFCFFLFFSTSLFAQNSTNGRAQRRFDNAQAYLNKQAYPDAILELQEAVNEDAAFQYAYIQLGDVYRRLKNYDKSKVAYAKAVQINPTFDVRVYYSLAESQLNTGEYEPAIKNFRLFISKYMGNDQKLIDRARKYLADCEFSAVAIRKPKAYEPVNLGEAINTKYHEYFPALTADGSTMIFSRVIDKNEDFFISQKDKIGQWGTAVPMTNVINTKNYNEGAQSLSPDGMYLYFTGCNRPDSFGSCDIYVSHKNGKTWDAPFNLGAAVNSSCWDSQPAISPDGSTLYFSSNRPGGFGGYDIWKTTLKDDGTWTKPENLGADINTSYDENTPFIHPDGQTLYFSSDGWPGFGNKDIFFSRLGADQKWTTPVNIGYPINTFNEETGLIVTPDGQEGLFSSNLKDGFGDLDLYRFKMPADAKPQRITYVKGTVRDKESHTPLESTVLVVDLKSKKKQYFDYTSKETGTFLAVMPIGGSYALNVSTDGYLFYSDHFELNDSINRNKPVELVVYLEKIKTGLNTTLKNIFFDTNKYELLPTSVTELATLVELLKQNPQVSIEIQGFTDDIGNNDQNLELSKNRAKAVYDYLVSHGVKQERLDFKGFGEAKPVASNVTEDGRQKNRRTSFVITKT
jgi:outer membrane protein OmpA-like peptidoglycan-associated protein/Tol biopolymer transport system component